jgi:RND family efflux transporter MFP subunit
VKISAPENEINKFSTGKKARITVSALSGKAFEGSVTNISPVAELMSRTYTVKIAVDNPGQELKPGMVCDVDINLGEPASVVLVVPVRAVSKDADGNTYVYLVSPDQKTVKKQIITVGQYRGSGIEVTGGLSEGQTIVSEGVEKLIDNSPISL